MEKSTAVRAKAGELENSLAVSELEMGRMRQLKANYCESTKKLDEQNNSRVGEASKYISGSRKYVLVGIRVC